MLHWEHSIVVKVSYERPLLFENINPWGEMMSTGTPWLRHQCKHYIQDIIIKHFWVIDLMGDASGYSSYRLG